MPDAPLPGAAAAPWPAAALPLMGQVGAQVVLVSMEPCSAFAPHYQTDAGETLYLRMGARHVYPSGQGQGPWAWAAGRTLAAAGRACTAPVAGAPCPADPRARAPGCHAGTLDVVLRSQGRRVSRKLVKGDLMTVPPGAHAVDRPINPNPSSCLYCLVLPLLPPPSAAAPPCRCGALLPRSPLAGRPLAAQA